MEIAIYSTSSSDSSNSQITSIQFGGISLEINKNDKRPIAKFYRSWLDDIAKGVPLNKCRGINHDQYRAADRMARDYERAFAGGGGKGYAVIADKHQRRVPGIDKQVQSLHDHQRVFERLAKKSQEIIEHVVLQEKPVRQYELKQVPQWPKGVGTARLREALDELVEIYRKN